MDVSADQSEHEHSADMCTSELDSAERESSVSSSVEHEHDQRASLDQLDSASVSASGDSTDAGTGSGIGSDTGTDELQLPGECPEQHTLTKNAGLALSGLTVGVVRPVRLRSPTSPPIGVFAHQNSLSLSLEHSQHRDLTATGIASTSTARTTVAFEADADLSSRMQQSLVAPEASGASPTPTPTATETTTTTTPVGCVDEEQERSQTTRTTSFSLHVGLGEPSDGEHNTDEPMSLSPPLIQVLQHQQQHLYQHHHSTFESFQSSTSTSSASASPGASTRFRIVPVAYESSTSPHPPLQSSSSNPKLLSLVSSERVHRERRPTDVAASHASVAHTRNAERSKAEAEAEVEVEEGPVAVSARELQQRRSEDSYSIAFPAVQRVQRHHSHHSAVSVSSSGECSHSGVFTSSFSLQHQHQQVDAPRSDSPLSGASASSLSLSGSSSLNASLLIGSAAPSLAHNAAHATAGVPGFERLSSEEATWNSRSTSTSHLAAADRTLCERKSSTASATGTGTDSELDDAMTTAMQLDSSDGGVGVGCECGREGDERRHGRASDTAAPVALLEREPPAGRAQRSGSMITGAGTLCSACAAAAARGAGGSSSGSGSGSGNGNENETASAVAGRSSLPSAVCASTGKGSASPLLRTSVTRSGAASSGARALGHDSPSTSASGASGSGSCARPSGAGRDSPIAIATGSATGSATGTGSGSATGSATGTGSAIAARVGVGGVGHSHSPVAFVHSHLSRPCSRASSFKPIRPRSRSVWYVLTLRVL